MKRISLLVTLVVLGGLMISGQALAALSGEQLRQWNDQQPVIGENFKQWHQNWNQTQDQTLTQEFSVFQIREMQRLLTENGYVVGNVGGILDEGTMTALRHFQEAEGLALTGMPDEQTLRALALIGIGGQLEFFGLSPAYGEMDYNEGYDNDHDYDYSEYYLNEDN
ncbi:MAG: hypothetical protein BA863_15865 [Desulfovibrio sp. S3730MH75]|nr:MAG: hypothetical protein BA863_15865 [Desulfovibrio sp. S3730MH75]